MAAKQRGKGSKDFVLPVLSIPILHKPIAPLMDDRTHRSAETQMECRGRGIHVHTHLMVLHVLLQGLDGWVQDES